MKRRLRHKRLTRHRGRSWVSGAIVAALGVAMVVGAVFVPAARANPVFGTMNDVGGIYWRSGPDWGTPVAVPGNGIYPGTVISVSCYASGTSVPGSADTMWVQASVVSGPGSGSGWVNEHFVNDGAAINTAAAGVPPCGGSSGGGSLQGSSVSVQSPSVSVQGSTVPLQGPTAPVQGSSSPVSSAGPSGKPQSGSVFGTMNDVGGIYWRSGPDWGTPVAVPGNGIYPGTMISVSCYASGTSVPGSADTMWVQASVVSGPGSGSGWVNEHFVNDGAPINTAAAGVPRCGGSSISQPAATSTGPSSSSAGSAGSAKPSSPSVIAGVGVSFGKFIVVTITPGAQTALRYLGAGAVAFGLEVSICPEVTAASVGIGAGVCTEGVAALEALVDQAIERNISKTCTLQLQLRYFPPLRYQSKRWINCN